MRGDARTIVGEAGTMARIMLGEQIKVVLPHGKDDVSDAVVL